MQVKRHLRLSSLKLISKLNELRRCQMGKHYWRQRVIASLSSSVPFFLSIPRFVSLSGSITISKRIEGSSCSRVHRSAAPSNTSACTRAPRLRGCLRNFHTRSSVMSLCQDIALYANKDKTCDPVYASKLALRTRNDAQYVERAAAERRKKTTFVPWRKFRRTQACQIGAFYVFPEREAEFHR